MNNISSKDYCAFASYSGDAYHIPKKQFASDVREYNIAVRNMDEQSILKFEEGFTGWIYNE